jgi:hypothetical protein
VGWLVCLWAAMADSGWPWGGGGLAREGVRTLEEVERL